LEEEEENVMMVMEEEEDEGSAIGQAKSDLKTGEMRRGKL
jgi:hypothetical protein